MSRGPTAAEHRDWAVHNRAVFEELGGVDADHLDWAAVVLFYTAVHELQAFFVTCGLRPRLHQQRRALLQEPVNAAQIGALLPRRYGGLENLSRQARYECVVPSVRQVDRAVAWLRDVSDEISRLGRLKLVQPSGGSSFIHPA